MRKKPPRPAEAQGISGSDWRLLAEIDCIDEHRKKVRTLRGQAAAWAYEREEWTRAVKILTAIEADLLKRRDAIDELLNPSRKQVAHERIFRVREAAKAAWRAEGPMPLAQLVRHPDVAAAWGGHATNLREVLKGLGYPSAKPGRPKTKST